MISAWLNRTVIGAGLTSFLADLGYELACAVIPSFLLLLGVPPDQAPAAMGAIEAAAEFLSNAAKLVVGWWSDRIGKRKAMVVAGYALTGVAFVFCFVAQSWLWVMLAKSLAWFGKGIRGPLRNAIITDAVEPGHRGKAFGFHRAGDSAGAVLGPLVGALIIYLATSNGNVAIENGFDKLSDSSMRWAFLFTLVPGIASAIVFATMIREQRLTPKPGLRLGTSIRSLPTPFRRYLIGIFLFGLGDCAHSILILAATLRMQEFVGPIPGMTALASASIYGILLYAWRNLCQTLGSFPAGVLGDRFGHQRMLVIGYLLAAGTMSMFAVLMITGIASFTAWFLAFAMAGLYMAIQEALEPAIVPELVPDKTSHGTAFGVLAFINGLGDVIASLAVGLLVQAFGWEIGLGYAAAMMIFGAVWMAVVRR